MKFLGKKRWFTLIEMLIVIVIIGVLASALIPRLSSARGKANDAARKADMQQIATAIISRQLDTNVNFNDSTYFCAWACDVGTGNIAMALRQWWISSIPTDSSNQGKQFSWFGTTVANSTATGSAWYYFIPIKKNGIDWWSFVLMSKVESDGAANFVVYNATVWSWTIWTGTDFMAIQNMVCSSIKNWTLGSCTYNVDSSSDKGTLRYIYVY